MRAMSGRRWRFLLLALAVVAIALAMASNRVRGTAYYLSKSAFAAIEGETPEPVFEVARIEGKGDIRLYLLHGLENDESQWDLSALEAINSMDAQRIYVRLVVDDPSYFNDGGKLYCQAFFGWMAATQAKLNRAAQPSHTYVAGVSYGGLHAILAAGQLDFVDGYIALMPALELGRLPLFEFQSNNHCNPYNFQTYPPGFVSYAKDDDLVGAELIREFAKYFKVPNTALASGGHQVTARQALDARHVMENWAKPDAD